MKANVRLTNFDLEVISAALGVAEKNPPGTWTSKQFKSMQERIDEVEVPTDPGQIIEKMTELEVTPVRGKPMMGVAHFADGYRCRWAIDSLSVHGVMLYSMNHRVIRTRRRAVAISVWITKRYGSITNR